MAKKPPTAFSLRELEFDFIKSNFFRVIRADGAFGGVAPNGSIHMQLYSERQPIPLKVTHAINNGLVGQEIIPKRQGRKAIVREVEIDAVFEIQQAIAFRAWLDDKIKQVEQLMAQQTQIVQVVTPPTQNKAITPPVIKNEKRNTKNAIRRNTTKSKH